MTFGMRCVYAMGSLLLLTACATGTYSITKDPNGVWPRCIAVLPFDNLSQVDNAGRIVATTVADKMLRSGRYDVLEPMEASRILDALGMPRSSTIVDPAEAKRYGEALGVDGVIIGSVTRYRNPGASSGQEPDPSAIASKMRLISVGTGANLWSAHMSAMDDQILLAVPRPRHAMVTGALNDTLAPMLTQGVPRSDTPVCWKALPGAIERVSAQERFTGTQDVVMVRAQGGETLRQIAAPLLLHPKHFKVIEAANPKLTQGQLLRRGTQVTLPRFVPYTATEHETLASLAQNELGNLAYSTVIYAANADVLKKTEATPPMPARPGVLIDATQRWSLFDVVGSVADSFVVVNGVPALFPRVRVQLRWLVYGRKLKVRSNGKPAEATFFEVDLELKKFIASWKIKITTPSGKVVHTLAAAGPPPRKIPWNARLKGAKMINHTVYHYQMVLHFKDGTEVSSPVEAFGVNTTVEPPLFIPHALVRGRSLEVTAGRFTERFSTETFSGALSVVLQSDDGATGKGQFLVPTVTIVRPRRMEMLEVGVDGTIYRFPQVSVVDGRIDPRELDTVNISFTLTGQTEPGNEIVLDGTTLKVESDGLFKADLALHRGTNIFSILARSQQGSQTFLEEKIILKPLGPDSEPWEFSPATREQTARKARDPLPMGVSLRIPILRMTALQ